MIRCSSFFNDAMQVDSMELKRHLVYIAFTFAMVPNYVFASFFTAKTYTLRAIEKDIKWVFDRRVFKLDGTDAYYLYGSPWKKTYTFRSRYSDCERDHSNNFHGRYLVCPLNHFKYSRRYTMCFVCNYSFREHFQWTQQKFFVEGIDQFDSSKNAARPYVSKILGEGLERMHRWKASQLYLNTDFNPKIHVYCYGSGCEMEFP